jgi:hypothetical protein
MHVKVVLVLLAVSLAVSLCLNLIMYSLMTSSSRLSGTSGDPAKNVNVTNWPIDEEGNLKVKIVPAQRTLPSILELRAIYRQYYSSRGDWALEPLLVDKDTFAQLYRFVYYCYTTATTYTAILNKSFIYQMPSTKPFSILGQCLINFRFYTWIESGTAYFRGTIYLVKMTSDGREIVLGSCGVGELKTTSTQGETKEGTYAITFTNPVTINKYERIAIRFYVEAFNTFGYRTYFRHETSPTWDDKSSSIIIPIVET